jgi:quinol monooxygenase YgiN
MLLAYVKITIAENDRQKALDILMEEVPIVTAMPGCLNFSPYLDPANEQFC